MHIQFVEIGNYRKLQAVRIDFTEKTTVFVGANNSGKTSAMVALKRFLVDRGNFSVNDLTMTRWSRIDAEGVSWEAGTVQSDTEELNWGSILPHVDLWLNVPGNQAHYVQKLLPTIDWVGPLIGVRLRYEPKDLARLKAEYLAARRAAAIVMGGVPEAIDPANPTPGLSNADTFALWPKSLMDFLSRRLHSAFEVRVYVLDPDKLADPSNGEANPQVLPAGSEAIDGDPLKNLIHVDEISAQRGFGWEPASTRSDGDEPSRMAHGGKKLSSQLRSYYSQHLDPFDQPEPEDLEALQALHEAQAAFGQRLSTSFSSALKELEDIGYPGVTDPKLTISTIVKPVDGLNHGSAVQYEVPTHLAAAGQARRLPEDSNGLGYQNLVSMVFALMSFRDKWMKVGKASKVIETSDALIPPLHLVLIEEPEAHLHAQVQQVFVTQAYGVLRKHVRLMGSEQHRTQLIISTHSSHLAREAEFTSLRYFRRMPMKAVAGSVPIASVVNLSQVFGSEPDTERFVKRYLKVTHCDLLFADGAVLVEGPAERIVVPHFVSKRSEYEYLRRCYINWLEIGGSHAHRLRALITQLGLNVLIITDLDAKDSDNKSVPPVRGKQLKTRNETLKTWIPKRELLDALFDAAPEDLVLSDPSGYGVRIAYQQPVKIVFKATESAEALANTFEDALVYENLDLFSAMTGTGLIGRLNKVLKESSSLEELTQKIGGAIGQGGKAEFALDLLSSEDIDKLKVPTYIDRGLLWLAGQLKRKEDYVGGKAALGSENVTANKAGGPATGIAE